MGGELAAHVEVLQVHNGRSAGVLAYVCSGFFAAHVHPAGIQFGLQVCGGNAAVQDIQTVLPVYLLEFKVVVMVQQSQTHVGCHLTDLCHHFDGFFKLFSTGTAFFGYIGNNYVLAADFLVCSQSAFGVFDHIDQRNVSRNGCQPQFFAPCLDIGRSVSEQTGEFHACVTDFLNLCQSGLHIGFHAVTDRVQLYSYR